MPGHSLESVNVVCGGSTLMQPWPSRWMQYHQLFELVLAASHVSVMLYGPFTVRRRFVGAVGAAVVVVVAAAAVSWPRRRRRLRARARSRPGQCVGRTWLLPSVGGAVLRNYARCTRADSLAALGPALTELREELLHPGDLDQLVGLDMPGEGVRLGSAPPFARRGAHHHQRALVVMDHEGEEELVEGPPTGLPSRSS